MHERMISTHKIYTFIAFTQIKTSLIWICLGGASLFFSFISFILYNMYSVCRCINLFCRNSLHWMSVEWKCRVFHLTFRKFNFSFICYVCCVFLCFLWIDTIFLFLHLVPKVDFRNVWCVNFEFCSWFCRNYRYFEGLTVFLKFF